MSASSTSVVEDMEVRDDSLEITIIDYDDPSNGLHVTKRDIATKTVHTRIELI